MLVESVVCFALGVVGAVVSGMHGGWHPKLGGWVTRTINSHSLEAWILALPATILTGLASDWNVIFIMFAFLLAALSVRLGHGQYMTLPYSLKLIDPEKIDGILQLFFGVDPRTERPTKHGILDLESLPRRIAAYGEQKLYWRNISGLALGGVIGVIMPALVLPWWAALSVLVIGSSKAWGYMWAWSQYPKEGDMATSRAELIRGALLWFGLSAIGCLLVGGV